MYSPSVPVLWNRVIAAAAQAWLWRRNAMNTAGNPVPERETQPAELALYRIIFRECARHQVQAAF